VAGRFRRVVFGSVGILVAVWYGLWCVVGIS
jgi:hypothetical protein